MEIREVEVSRILNPTSIDLGEYVINPYRGCAVGCLYCYARFIKTAQRDSRKWGEYVDVRGNAPKLLEKELAKKKPKRVLLGSTTECFQPVERVYRLSRRILEILNENRVYYSILTRSPFILDCLALLKEKYCESVYFTVSDYPQDLKSLLEPNSASFDVRRQAIERLLEEKVPVVPYVSPVLPFIFDARHFCESFYNAGRIEFEGLNFNLGNIEKVIMSVISVYPELKEHYLNMKSDGKIYDTVWETVERTIAGEAEKAGKKYHIYVHGLGAYFNNKYQGNH